MEYGTSLLFYFSFSILCGKYINTYQSHPALGINWTVESKTEIKTIIHILNCSNDIKLFGGDLKNIYFPKNILKIDCP